jgi:hypothetical protein
MEIALDIFEPLQRVARSRLQAQDFQAALILINRKGRGQIRFAVKQIRQRYCGLQSQL